MAITKKDIEKLSEVFATKKDIEKLSDVFATKAELTAGLNSLKNEFLSSQDKVMKKLEDISIEQKMAFAQYNRQEEKLGNHETRLKTLEEKVLV